MIILSAILLSAHAATTTESPAYSSEPISPLSYPAPASEPHRSLASFALPAQDDSVTDDGGLYLQLGFGLTSAQDSGGPDSANDVEYDQGELYSLALGMHFGPAEPGRLGFDLELEAIYGEQEIEARGGIVDPSDTSFAALMVNGLLDFSLSEQFALYGGAGIGIAGLDVDSVDDGVNTFEDDDKALFAWQLKGGARLRMTSHTSLNLGYRWLQIDDATLSDSVNDVDFDLESGLHVLELGLRFTL